MKALFSFVLIVSGVTVSTFINADRLTIHNRTPRDLYVGIYYIGLKLPWMKEYPKGKLASRIHFLETESSGIIERPARKIGYDRELVFVEDQGLLKPELTKEELMHYHSKNVGDMQGDVFYIGDKEGEFYGFTTIQWNVEKPIIESLRAKAINQLPAIKENPYKNCTATVRIGNTLAPEEKEYLAQRMPRVKQSLEKFIGKPFTGEPIKIALICSGGGTRAMLYTLGICKALEQAGFMDCITYVVTLSGATWGISSWLASNVSLNEYSDWIVQQLNSGLVRFTCDDMGLIAQMLMTKYLYDQPLGPIDLYGALLANIFCGMQPKLKQRVNLTSSATRIKSGQIPLPIYTAVRAENIAVENMWYEFTPFEVGGAWLGMYAPTAAFGSKFHKGTCSKIAPALSLGNLMGIWGFAIGVSFARIIQEIDLEKKMPFTFAQNIVTRIEKKSEKVRPFKAEVLNFSYGMLESPVKDLPRLSLTDAGVSFSMLPYPPVSGERKERMADLLIFIDASDSLMSLNPENLKGGPIPTLQVVENYARSHKLSFPHLNYGNITKKVVSLFKDENEKTPVAVYQPRILDRHEMRLLAAKKPGLRPQIEELENFDVERCFKVGTCASQNFTYSVQDARNIMTLGQMNGYLMLDTLIDSINWIAKKRNLITQNA